MILSSKTSTVKVEKNFRLNISPTKKYGDCIIVQFFVLKQPWCIITLFQKGLWDFFYRRISIKLQRLLVELHKSNVHVSLNIGSSPYLRTTLVHEMTI